MKLYGQELIDFEAEVSPYLVQLSDKIQSIKKAFKGLSNYSGVIEGETANAVDAYINEVHLQIIDKLDDCIQDYSDELRDYIIDMNDEVDSQLDYIDSDYLEDLKDDFKTNRSNFTSVHSEISSFCSKYSDVIDSKTPDISQLKEGLNDSKNYIKDAYDALVDHDTAHKGALENMLTLISEIETLCGDNAASKINGKTGTFEYESKWYLDELGLLSDELDMDVVNELLSKMVQYDEDGNPIYDWDYIFSILNKYNSKTSESEYYALAIVFLDMDTKDMEKFLKACLIRGEKILTSYDYTPDTEKINNILKYANAIADSVLYQQLVIDSLDEEKIKELYQAKYPDADISDFDSEDMKKALLNELRQQRESMRQKTSLLSVFSEGFTVQGSSDYPSLFLKSVEDGSIELSYSYAGHEISRSVIISATEKGSYLGDMTNEEIKAYFNETYSMSLGQFAVEEVSDEAISQIIDGVFEAALGASESALKSGSSFLTGAGIDFIQETVKNEIGAREGERLTTIIDDANYCSKFGLEGNLVTQESKYLSTQRINKSSTIYCYPSENTQAVIDRMNDYLDNSIEDCTITIDNVRYDGVKNKITINDVLNNQELMNEIVSIIKDRDDGGYDEIIGH